MIKMAEIQEISIVKKCDVFETWEWLKVLILNLINKWFVSWDGSSCDVPFYDILNWLKDYGSDQFNWIQLPKTVKENIKSAYIWACTEYKLFNNLA